MEKTFEEKTYVICHNGSDVIHPAVVEKGTVLATGQPQLEEFSTEEEWKKRLDELGYKDPHKAMAKDRPELAKLAKGAEPDGFTKGAKFAPLSKEQRAKMSPDELKAHREQRKAQRTELRAQRQAAKGAHAHAAPALAPAEVKAAPAEETH